MTRNVDRSLLTKAKKNKNDEFYTQRVDIDKELQHYQSKFRNKIVYCNTDNPLASNFVKYFIDNFSNLGLKRLIATGYAANDGECGTYFSYTGSPDELAAYEAGNVQYLHGDGDFRSSECLSLLQESDIVVTNPPYSLLREFISHMESFDKDFLIVATVNAITYKDVFRLIHAGKIWLGVGLGRDISGFIVPEWYELYGTEARINDRGERIVSTNNSLWLTTLDFERRHKDIPLVKTYKGNESDYPHYDNLNGINISKTKDIPSDWFGLMGVPITSLHKHNPEQFEIVRFRKGDDGKDLRINGKQPYFRIIIKRKSGQSSDHQCNDAALSLRNSG
ncbi:adenine-specific methyltransferase EcoRI family protein [Corynebacterium oculi]|uniref:Modification methylase EcoRI n=1 Tax=Corynebacterium oculi TaxID=1544416 RepID=A0A0Q1ABL7_9CORY|nr:adenine-specific methyltransferase EcoRI family protein [Corynebacterium oculi]KQB84061.1 hypothetical protein Cocul_00857 [Corynebacterium oculi]